MEGFHESSVTKKIEKPSRTYIFRDTHEGKYEAVDGRVKWFAPVVFECTASSQEEADQKYEASIGIDPKKQNHIECLSTEIEGAEN